MATCFISVVANLQVMQCDTVKAQKADSLDPTCFFPSSPREKWLRRRTHVKLRVSDAQYTQCSYCMVIANAPVTTYLQIVKL